MKSISKPVDWSLEDQKAAFSKRKFLATPLAGMFIWLIIGVAGIFLPQKITEWVLFIGTGSIIYLGMFISKFTGENFINPDKPKNTFDALFLYAIGQALLVYAIAIPFYLLDASSLPLSVGILTGLMWFVFSWIIGHWVGIFHAVFRTFGILVLWYAWPQLRFISIPFLIVLLYILSMTILQKNRA